MKTKQAINRIFWRFGGNGNQKPFPVNAEDIEAFNKVSEYHEQTQTQQFEQNELFAKLFIVLYGKMISHYDTDIFDDAARKSIYKVLKKPLNQIIQEFTQNLNDSDKYELIKSIQDEIKHPVTLSGSERYASIEKNKEAFKSDDNVKRLITNAWDFKTVNECLIAEVNQALNIFK